MKELEQYLGETYINSCQPAIITKTPASFPNPEIPTVIPDMGAKRPKMDVEMTYFEKNIIGEAIHNKLRNNDVYETDMLNIYNLILGQTNKQLQ